MKYCFHILNNVALISMKRVHIHFTHMLHYFIYASRHTETKTEFPINFCLPSRKYYLAQAYFAGWTLIDLVRGKSTTFSHVQERKTIWPISPSSSLCYKIGFSASALHCSTESHFCVMVKAVFLNFIAFFFVFWLSSYPSNTTQMSLAHLHLPHPNDSYPPSWHARSMNADDAL